MSSISTASSSSRSFEPITVDYRGGEQYAVNGKPASEAEVNQKLAARGIVATRGSFRTGDGFELSSTNADAVTLAGDAPLPNVGGPVASPDVAAQKVQWLNEISDAALQWVALSTLAHTAMTDMKVSKQLKNAMESQKIEMKKNQINATEQQIAAERKAATEQLIFSVVAAAATFVIGGATANPSPAQDKFSVTSGLSQASYAIGNVVTAAGNAYSKHIGAQREADEKKLETKRYEREEAIVDQMVDTAKSNYEESRELFKNALKIMSEYMERKTQVTQKITS